MELGEKMRLARLEAGLSQRQLCEGLITRNMLSQIENGSARPSVKTLSALAERLGKPAGFFLEEEAVVSPNQRVMEQARAYYDSGQFREAANVLEEYRQPDSMFDREMRLLQCLTFLAMAEAALAQGRRPYAKLLLEKAEPDVPYCREALTRHRLLLLGRMEEEPVSGQLPGLDEELLLRAREALAKGQTDRAEKLLEAAEDHTSSRWLLLRGQVWAKKECYNEAARCFHGAEMDYPEKTAQWLETCYRELEDYRQAYNYARKQRK